jgi:hypothetical protein
MQQGTPAMGVIPVSFFVFFGFLVGVLAVGSLLLQRFMSLLRAHRPPLGDDILGGAVWWRYPYSRSFMRFLFSGDYRRLGDRRIARFGNILRLYHWAYLVLAWLILLTSLVIENR